MALANSTDGAGSSSTIDSQQLLIGFASLLLSCVSLGFMFAPLRRFNSKDGFFVQWVECAVVFLFGFVINIVRGAPPFNLIACIGGALYATGNIGSVPIVSEMGVGVGMLVWGSVQIVIGWCVAHFGLFGTRQQGVHNEALNYTGVVLTLLSGFMFVFVYGSSPATGKDGGGEEGGRREAIAPEKLTPTNYGSHSSPPSGHRDLAADQQLQQQPIVTPDRGRNGVGGHPLLSRRKLMFIGFAVLLGCLHGLMMTPIVYIQDTDPAHSDNVIDYVFAHFSAVFFFSTVYFLTYALWRRERVYVPRELIIPSALYGVLWSVGMVLWIVANHLLPQTVAFPIAVRLPAIIGALADVFIFRSISGSRELLYLFGAIAVGVTGVVLVAVSL